MDEINAKVETHINLSVELVGLEGDVTLRAFFDTGSYFVGFFGNSTQLIIPPLSTILIPEVDRLRLTIEALVDNYRLEVWQGDVVLNNTLSEMSSRNIINVSGQLIEVSKDEKREIKVSLRG